MKIFEMKERWNEYLLSKTPIEAVLDFIGLIMSVAAFISSLVNERTMSNILSAVLVILLIIISIMYKKLRKNSLILDGLFNNNVPMISTISYILNTAKRKEYNSIHINKAIVTYEFTSPNNKENQDYMANQCITWRFCGTNEKNINVKTITLLLSKSIFDSYDKIEFYVVNNNRNLLNSDVSVTPRQHLLGMQKYIDIEFAGYGIEPNHCFDISLIMKWTHPEQFTNAEYFILDPTNYSINIDNVEICIQSDLDFISKSRIALHEHDRTSFEKIDRTILMNKLDCAQCPEANTCSKNIKIKSHSFSPSRNRIYLLEFNRTTSP